MEKGKLLPHQNSRNKRPKKWLWLAEAVELLLKYIKEFKTKCNFNGMDSEAYLSSVAAGTLFACTVHL